MPPEWIVGAWVTNLDDRLLDGRRTRSPKVPAVPCSVAHHLHRSQIRSAAAAPIEAPSPSPSGRIPLATYGFLGQPRISKPRADCPVFRSTRTASIHINSKTIGTVQPAKAGDRRPCSPSNMNVFIAILAEYPAAAIKQSLARLTLFAKRIVDKHTARRGITAQNSDSEYRAWAHVLKSLSGENWTFARPAKVSLFQVATTYP